MVAHDVDLPRNATFLPEPVGETRDDLVLHLEEVGDRLLEPLGPQVRACRILDQLHFDAHAVSAPLDAAREDLADVQFAPDLFQVDRLAFVGEGRRAAYDEGAGNARQVGRQALGDAFNEIVPLRPAADIGEGEDDDREARRGRLFRGAGVGLAGAGAPTSTA